MQLTRPIKFSKHKNSKKLQKGLTRTSSEPDMHINTYNLWNAKSTDEEKIFKVIRNS